ncbi:MAG: peptide chain release factor N(5)-glutamine methyltransferase [Lachnospiraceae bacterium]|nr:peptide chain release factor N(5)-glutamine methyltransferase [Lachnospiraceae bacterium]
MNYRQLYDFGRGALEKAGITDAAVDAGLLLQYVCGTDRGYLYAHGDSEVSEKDEEAYRDLLEKRSKRIPLQHLTGTCGFMGLDFKVSKDVLIPRQDTEILVEEALKNTYDGMKVLDMCTGSGCILISILNYKNDCKGLGVDLSEAALDIARENADRLIPDKDFEFIKSDLFEKVEGKFDVIVSNPPYIRTDEIETLEPEVKDHEPRMALDGEGDGLIFYRRIAKECLPHLNGGGYLIFEIGYDQGSEVKDIMVGENFKDVTIVKDLAGLDRVVMGYKSAM